MANFRELYFEYAVIYLREQVSAPKSNAGMKLSPNK